MEEVIGDPLSNIDCSVDVLDWRRIQEPFLCQGVCRKWHLRTCGILVLPLANSVVYLLEKSIINYTTIPAFNEVSFWGKKKRYCYDNHLSA